MMNKEFIVFRKSENTNSFGLYQMFLMAKDGEAYKSCANSMNVKEVGTVITGSFNQFDSGNRSDCSFVGHELTERLDPDAPKDVVKEVWQLETV